MFCLLLIANSPYATKGPRQLSEFMYPCGSSVTLVNIENVWVVWYFSKSRKLWVKALCSAFQEKEFSESWQWAASAADPPVGFWFYQNGKSECFSGIRGCDSISSGLWDHRFFLSGAAHFTILRNQFAESKLHVFKGYIGWLAAGLSCLALGPASVNEAFTTSLCVFVLKCFL